MKEIIIIGNLTADAEQVEYNGKPSLRFSVAVNDTYKKDAPATFFSCRYHSVGVGEFLKRGKRVSVIGEFSMNETIDDNNQKKVYLNIFARNLELLGNKPTEDKQEIPF